MKKQTVNRDVKVISVNIKPGEGVEWPLKRKYTRGNEAPGQKGKPTRKK